MNVGDLVGFLTYGVQWLFPVVMIFLYGYKTSKLNNFYQIFYLHLLAVLFVYVIFMFIQHDMPYVFYLFSTYPTTYLMTFYGLICLAFTYYLIVVREWDFPQAFAISVICTSIGTFFWEIPTIIYNLFMVGYEVDIFLQLFVILFFIFVYGTCGWKSDRKTIFVFLFGVVISILFLYFRPIMPQNISNESLYWNSPYFMINRFINTVIVLYCVSKNKPMEKSKSKC